jgi:PAS domain S-box-containing protein
MFEIERQSLMRIDNFSYFSLDARDKMNRETNTIFNIFRKKKGGNKQSESDSAQDYDIILNLIPDGILIANQFGKVIATNDAYHTLTGFSKEEIVGKSASEIPAVEITDKSNLWVNIVSVLTKGELKGFEFTYNHADGSKKWGEARAKLFRSGLFSGGAIAVLRDITERKRKDEELNKLLGDLERSNRELDEYTYAVSHDLKSPLRTIGSFSTFLLEDYSGQLDDQAKEYLGRMKSATQRMTELIDDLLKISRIGRMNTDIELIDVNQIITSIVADNQSLLDNKNGKITAGELPRINSQRVWVTQLFSNLVNNGLKFNESSNPTIWIECEENEDHYLFSVKDNGIGIDKKHHEKIFKIFQRLHTTNEYPGTGAGLSICKKILESWGGEISVESEVGQGSTFLLKIPKNMSPIDEEPNMLPYDNNPAPESILVQE